MIWFEKFQGYLTIHSFFMAIHFQRQQLLVPWYTAVYGHSCLKEDESLQLYMFLANIWFIGKDGRCSDVLNRRWARVIVAFHSFSHFSWVCELFNGLCGSAWILIYIWSCSAWIIHKKGDCQVWCQWIQLKIHEIALKLQPNECLWQFTSYNYHSQAITGCMIASCEIQAPIKDYKRLNMYPTTVQPFGCFQHYPEIIFYI